MYVCTSGGQEQRVGWRRWQRRDGRRRGGCGGGGDDVHSGLAELEEDGCDVRQCILREKWPRHAF